MPKLVVDLEVSDGEIYQCASIEGGDENTFVYKDWYWVHSNELITDLSWYDLSNAEVGSYISGLKVLKVETID